MLIEAKRRYGNFLEELADTLDLTEAQHEEAKARYTAVANFLSKEGTLLSKFNPEVLPQGSIRIGTTVRPIGENAEFDIDLTCVLHVSLPGKQSDLRSIVESRLNESTDYKRMLSKEEHRRCLRLHYKDEPKFHLDIVPSIRDQYGWLLKQDVEKKYAEHAILISDIENESFNNPVNRELWPKSNTEGYALWFLDRMKIEAESIRMRLKAELLLESVEDVPEFKVRTPLQRGIQLMKRHRDTMFIKDQELMPVSIIITTLAARSYEKVMSKPPSQYFYDILMAMIDTMPEFVKKKEGEYFIENPVNKLENFGDKWNENPLKAKKFFEWLDQFKYDFQQSFLKGDIQSAVTYIRPMFTNRSINEALQNFQSKNIISLNENRNLPVKYHAEHRQYPIWPVTSLYHVSISGEYKSARDTSWVNADKDGMRLPVNCFLMFHALTNVPPPFQVFWQIVNTGEEAKRSRCLRGEIFPAQTAGTGGLSQPEATAYVGQHWVQCFIVKDGICVAQSTEYPVTVI